MSNLRLLSNCFLLFLEAMFERIKAIVLAGGHSVRMGSDKGNLVYHRKPQKYHTADLLKSLGIKTFISQRKDQSQTAGYQYIIDIHDSIGPMGGLASAFDYSLSPWLLVACDYPFLEVDQIIHLLTERDKSKKASAYFDAAANAYIPTCAIYERSFEPLVFESISVGQYSLNNLLKNVDTQKVITKSDHLLSIDSSEDKFFAENKLKAYESYR